MQELPGPLFELRGTPLPVPALVYRWIDDDVCRKSTDRDHALQQPRGFCGISSLREDYHQQYLAKNPDGYCGIGGCGVPFKVAELRDGEKA